jgi:hypothetical protein
VIDVFAILNALRAVHGDGRARRGVAPTDVGERFRAEHREFAADLQRIRATADHLGELPPDELRRELAGIRTFLLERLPRHEEEEEADVYPVVARAMGGEDPLSSMSRAHLEISHLGRLYQTVVDDLPPEGPTAEDLVDLRRLLYGLHAVLRLHFAQEEEVYAWLASESGSPSEAVAR